MYPFELHQLADQRKKKKKKRSAKDFSNDAYATIGKSFTLKMLSKTVADNILIFLLLPEKIRLGISCELSA